MTGLVLVSLSGAVCPHTLLFSLGVLPEKEERRADDHHEAKPDRAQEKTKQLL